MSVTGTLVGYPGGGGGGGGGGEPGPTGPTGPTGPAGASAYAIAVANGFVGTEAEWLASLEPAEGGGVSTSLPFTILDGSGFVGDAEATAGLLYPTTALVRCTNAELGTLRIPAGLAPAVGQMRTIALQVEDGPVRVAPASDVVPVARSVLAHTWGSRAYNAVGTDLDLTLSGATLAAAGNDRVAVVDVVMYSYEPGTLDNITVTTSSSTEGFTPGTATIVRHNPANSMDATSPWLSDPHRWTVFVPLGSSGTAQQLSVRIQGDQNVYTASAALVVVNASRQAAPFVDQSVSSAVAFAGFATLAERTIPAPGAGSVGLRVMHGRRLATEAEPSPIAVFDPAPAGSAMFYAASGFSSRFRAQVGAWGLYAPESAMTSLITLQGGDSESRVVSTLVMLPQIGDVSAYPFTERTIAGPDGDDPVTAWVQLYPDTVKVVL
jgi:hypothetical protein